jgi:hypothetical protein
MLRIAVAILVAMIAHAATAATCTWNTASGNWSAAANWTGCADAPGPSTRSPGATDIAVVSNGTANLDASPTVSEFELGVNGVLSVVGGTKTFDVVHALRFAGGKATTILGSNQLLLYLHAGGTGTLTAPTTLENAVFFENSGSLALGSASATALTLLVAAEVRNMAGGTVTMSGGNSRLIKEGSSSITNNVGATWAISGNTTIGRATANSALGPVYNSGTMTLTGPATLSLPLGGGVFRQFGSLTVSNATIICKPTGVADTCSFQDWAGAEPTGAVTRLANGTLDFVPASNYTVGPSSTLAGSGTVNSGIQLRGTLAVGTTGTPYATLVVAGGLIVQTGATLDFDIGGTTTGTFDRLQVGTSAQVGSTTVFEGNGRLILHLAAGFNPALNAATPIMTYASVIAGSQFNRIDANYALDYAARFDATALQVFPAPRVTIDNASVLEGATGQASLVINAHLSQPSTQTIAIELRNHDGTAVYGLPPAGDYLLPDEYVLTFNPGAVLTTQTYLINGDAVVEGDESFAVEMYRNKVVNAALGNGIQGDPFAVGTILTDELPPETRFVLVGKDNGQTDRKVRRYTTAGIYIDSWDDRMPDAVGYIVTGLCFGPGGELLATRFAYPRPVLYSRLGAILNEDFGEPLAMSYHESCVFDRAGNVYIGIAGANGAPDASVPVRKFDHYGNLLDTFVLPTGTRGTDWIDLAGDQCTLYYTSEDTSVRRYNVCTHSSLGTFANGLTGPYCYALRLRPNRELMVACQDAVHRLDALGSNLKTYTRASIGEADPNGLFAMNLDPDGTSFWTAGLNSGNVYRVDIESGDVLGSFNSGAGGVAGLVVYDELHDDTIFLDGFEAAAPLSPIVFGASLTAEAESETEFEPDLGADMPAFVPNWMRVVAHERFERERGE